MKKDNSWLLFVVILLLVMLFGYLSRESEGEDSSEVKSWGSTIEYPGQIEFDAEVDAAGGWENYQLMQKQQDCFDACMGYDDPLCEICANIR